MAERLPELLVLVAVVVAVGGVINGEALFGLLLGVLWLAAAYRQHQRRKRTVLRDVGSR